ncbi:glycosyltransferase family 2 protein [Sediminitomix flava]|uniref:Glycosyl transferase family 2 n=1 Tax=Sediminitomix flava TaxID=379075 RepID=A0A315ZIL1_SEDFL|nr:glycosyltransferase family 2 protein [Sediminitomix flava]PWJ45053.1 glycosyl transferase family 2 [Sediminitomix flava]
MQKVTIITISFNCREEIETTIKSVLAQTYQNIEYLVIDGASNDGTVDIIQKYSDKIDTWVSEKDEGIYDAMNKGVKMATGDWILFMNAGDWFAADDAVEKIFSQDMSGFGLVYGDHEVVYDKLTKVKKALPVEDLWKGMIFSHQALFTKTQLLLDHPFEGKRWKRCADFHFIYNRWKDGVKFHHIPIHIACFRSGGLSDIQAVQAKEETWAIVKERDDRSEVDEHYKKLISYEKKVTAIRKKLPPSAFEYLMKLKNLIAGKNTR